ncbi:MAG TPA: FecR domain-containing protein [Chitinophaga sp.]|uniref:FecR family protein n=1 Tax=Chitinophaga sp. TaxID=1869181 RepID=UPI002C9A2C4B|nr:FecR domain-containing protein [Chitinophaga sp.]HVI46494.1 FecR domain-containing protein [Chitinophaga sp.]
MNKKKKNEAIDWEKIHQHLDAQGGKLLPDGELNDEEQQLLKELLAIRSQAGELKGWEGVNVSEDLAKLKARLSLSAPATPVVPVWRKTLRYAAILAVAAGTTWWLFQTKQAPDTNSGPGTFAAAAPGSIRQVTLPDNSKVWLNAGSRINYPTAFNGKQRAVELSGEAYFEVTADAHQPFVVNTGKQVVQVLGTAFNINAYGKHVITTLIAGSVSVGTSGQPGTTQILLPGQQAVFDKQTAVLNISSSTSATVTTWKSGQLAFRDIALDDLMDQLGQMYGYSITYINPPFRRLHYNIPSMPRPEKIAPLLDLLKATTAAPVNFSVDTLNRTIEIK